MSRSYKDSFGNAARVGLQCVGGAWWRGKLLAVVLLMTAVLAGMFSGDVYAENTIKGESEGNNCYYITYTVGDKTARTNSLCFGTTRDIYDMNDVTYITTSEGAMEPIALSDNRKIYMELVGRNPDNIPYDKLFPNEEIPSMKQVVAPNSKNGGASPEGRSNPFVALMVSYDGKRWEEISYSNLESFDSSDSRGDVFAKFASDIQNEMLARDFSGLKPADVTIDDTTVENTSEGERSDEEQPSSYGDEDVCYSSSGKLGWVLCPIINGIAGVWEYLWGEVETNFLQIRADKIFVEGEGVNAAWKIFRDIANVVFIIFFLFVIFSQLTGIGIDNYGIKKIMPKLIVVAILINLSYLLCALAVDISNILGVGLNSLFSSIASTIPVEVEGIEAGQSLVSWALGGAGTVAGVALFSFFVNPLGAALISLGTVAAIGLTVLGLLIVLIVSIVFMYFILVLRYAGVVILIAVAPVAIVCYMLPNTEKIWKRWLELLKALLLVYPICGALIGAGQLAGNILASTKIPSLAIAGMIVEVLPFFLVPMLLKRSLALMGNIGARLSGVGRGVGRGLSKTAQGGIRNTEKFKDWSKFATDRKLGERAIRIQRRLQARKDQGKNMSAWQNEKLLKATETANAYNQRGVQGRVGELLIDEPTMEQKMEAQKSNILEKMYSDNYAKMTNRGDVESAFVRALSGNNKEDTAAAMNALIQKGGTTEVLRALRGANWSTMDTGVKNYLMQTMAASNVDALKAFSKYNQSGGRASFQEWTTGVGDAIAAEASNGNIKAKTYAQYLMEGGENAMVNYSKDEMQFVQANADAIRVGMGDNDEFGAMLKNTAIKSNDAKAQTVAEDTMAGQLAGGKLNVNNFRITTEDIGYMRGRTAEAIHGGMMRQYIDGGMTESDARVRADRIIRSDQYGLGRQIANAMADPMIANRMKTGTRDVLIGPPSGTP